ncbi:MAG: chemotaxis protein CheW [Hyphomicrobiales bacterium]|nr:chemotaxis protein CheW [Hyphomicrobiales bacterium]
MNLARMSSRRIGLFTLHVGPETYGIPGDRAFGVFRLGRVTPAPLAPPALLGFSLVRGRILATISLARRLDPAARAPAEGSPGVAVEHGGDRFGLVADGIEGVEYFEPEDAVAAPADADPARLALCAGAYRRGDGIVAELDVGALLRLPVPRVEPALVRMS